MAIMRFENILSWGNIITLVVMGGGGLIAFTTVQTEVRYMQTLLEKIQRDRQDQEVRLRALELGFGRVEEKLISINSTLVRIDQSLRDTGGR